MTSSLSYPQGLTTNHPSAEETSGQPIKCYAQEPSFGPSDREYCQTLGIEVVDTPDAFKHVNSDALVFGIHFPHVAWGYALSENLPGLYVGTSLKSLDMLVVFSPGLDLGLLSWLLTLLHRLYTTLRDDKALPAVIERVQKMCSLGDRYAFPPGERHTWLESTFSSTEILWLRRKAHDAAETEGQKGG